MRLLRAAAALFFFALFALGALLLGPLMVLVRNRLVAHGLVRGLWRTLVRLFCAVRLIRLGKGNLAPCRGAVIVANHPSLIDVVLLVALVPKTLYVAKSGLFSRFPVSFAVRATALPDNAHLLDVAPAYLAQGWNVLIFPEGTRSPSPSTLQRFHRGAAQLALRAHAPLVCVAIRLSRRLLAKRQPAWDMGDKCVTYSFHASEPLAASCRAGESLHEAAVRLTQDVKDAIQANLT